MVKHQAETEKKYWHNQGLALHKIRPERFLEGLAFGTSSHRSFRELFWCPFAVILYPLDTVARTKASCFYPSS